MIVKCLIDMSEIEKVWLYAMEKPIIYNRPHVIIYQIVVHIIYIWNHQILIKLRQICIDIPFLLILMKSQSCFCEFDVFGMDVIVVFEGFFQVEVKQYGWNLSLLLKGQFGVFGNIINQVLKIRQVAFQIILPRIDVLKDNKQIIKSLLIIKHFNVPNVFGHLCKIGGSFELAAEMGFADGLATNKPLIQRIIQVLIVFINSLNSMLTVDLQQLRLA